MEAGTEQALPLKMMNHNLAEVLDLRSAIGVTDGGWGAAISHLAVGMEWSPDPPTGEARPTTRITNGTPKGN